MAHPAGASLVSDFNGLLQGGKPEFPTAFQGVLKRNFPHFSAHVFWLRKAMKRLSAVVFSIRESVFTNDPMAYRFGEAMTPVTTASLQEGRMPKENADSVASKCSIAFSCHSMCTD